MTLHAPYEPDNIFAKMIKGEIPCVKVYEDDIAFAFMDLFPQSKGHVLVIRKNVEARHFLDMPTDRLGPYMERVQMIARAVDKAFAPDGIVLTQFNGAPAGQTVFYLHFHIIPRREGEFLGRHASGRPADTEALKEMADQIIAAIEVL